MVTYLVTGGSGFCGFEIVKLLLEKKHKVRVLDIESMPEKLNNVEFIKADIRDANAVFNACKGIDRIIHTVAKVPISKAGREFFEVNAGGTKNVLQAALKLHIPKVVHISSSAVQLSEKNPVEENAPFNPIGIYAKSKLQAEYVCFEYRKKGLDVDIIRPRTVIGPGRLGIFDILFDWISESKNIYLIGSGKNKIQFIHSVDLAKCCYRASCLKGPNTFNVGSSAFSSLRDDLGTLIKHAKSTSKIVSLPIAPTIALLKALDFLHLSPLASWHYLTYHKDFYFNNKHAEKLLGWKPEYSNQEILIEAYDNYRSNKSAGVVYGQSHRKGLKQGVLGLIKRFS